MSRLSGRQRISRDGRLLSPEETVKPAAYRPEGKGRGLHAILETAKPWRGGNPVPLDGSLKGATVLLLWFRLNDRPIDGSAVWDRSAEIIAPSLAIALGGLASDAHLVVSVRTDQDRIDYVVDPKADRLQKLLARHFDWTFRAYVGKNPDADRAPASDPDVRSFKRERTRDLGKWQIVIDECYDAGAIEIWSRAYDPENLAARIDLEKVNESLGRVEVARFSAPRPVEP
jgi:hypothetical protein